MFLTNEELQSLTARVQQKAQIKALAKMGVPFIVRPDGKPMVLRSYLEKKFGEGQEPTQTGRKKTAPNLSMVA